jgi:hypothetical protein
LFKVPPILGQAQLATVATKDASQFLFIAQQP